MANSTGTAASCDQTHNSTQYFSNFTLGRQNLGLHGSTLILRASTRPYTAILQASHSLTFRYVSNRHPRARSVAFHGKQGLLCPWKRASHLRINSVKNVHILQPPRILSSFLPFPQERAVFPPESPALCALLHCIWPRNDFSRARQRRNRQSRAGNSHCVKFRELRVQRVFKPAAFT